MQVTRLYLQNYRVFERPLDLELPPGVVGIYGLNGAGKSTLLESIRFALFGKARTSLDQVRTADVKADCIAEIEFEHEGHLYVVRRTIAGANATVKARAHADGMQVAEGARDTARYVHSVLGMDDAAFRASVFAEQKQLAALSQQRPEERRKLVLQLLGITPVDAARDRARKVAREAEQQVERLRSILPDLDALRAELAEQVAAAEAAAEAAVAAEAAGGEARAALAEAEARHEQLDRRRQEHDVVAAELSAVGEELVAAGTRIERLERELADLDQASQRMEDLAAEAAGCAGAEARLRALEAVAAAMEAAAAVTVPPAPDPPDEAAAEGARAAADEARGRLAEVEGLVRAATDERKRAAEAVRRSASLSGEGDCPLCGQALGDAFEQVQHHRAAELAEVQARLGALTAERVVLTKATEGAAATAAAAIARLRRQQLAWSAFEQTRARRTEAERAVAKACEAYAAVAGGPPDPASLPVLATEVERRRAAAAEVARLRGRLERRPRLAADLEAERLAAASGRGRRGTLEEKLAGIAFVPAQLAAARAAREEARRRLEEAQRRAEAARVQAAATSAAVDGGRRRLADGETLHEKLGRQIDDARHLHRLGELLHSFRNSLVATVGPRLSAQAGELFAQLTDHEYDDLEVDPDTYEIKVRDQGQVYGMDRYSGSETDLANLALRVAISEHVQFQSGGTVGLLVLDEVFGPLDDDRKERMLLALERLKARFRQLLVVTHDASIKEQLPHALEVVKLPGRRATVRNLTR
ncbi:MAG: AAA family ATPase [Acidimicrobiia bacterium]